MKELLPFIISFAISVIITPFIIKLFKKLNIVDKPNERKIHKEPIPLGGGVGILIAFLIPALFYVEDVLAFLPFIFACIAIVVLGLMDDVKDIKAKKKLLFQILCAVFIVVCGIKVDLGRYIFKNSLFLAGLVDHTISVLWIVGVINAFNLIDGLDGLAGGIAAITAGGFAFIGVHAGINPVYILSLCLAGAALGFVIYNFNPAKIFMGDAGSMLLGFVLSVLAIKSVDVGTNPASLFAPVIILAVPIFDTGVSIIRRLASGKRIFSSDNGHLHHRVMCRLGCQKKAVFVIYAAGIAASIMGAIIFKGGHLTLAIALVVVLMGLGAFIGIKDSVPRSREEQIRYETGVKKAMVD